MTAPGKDLAVLVADKNIEHAMIGILGRTEALPIAPIEYTIDMHPQNDPGCLKRAAELLRVRQATHRNALVVFDLEGSGAEPGKPREQIEADLQKQLARTGWPASAAIAIEPELENWVWSGSPHVARVLGWQAGLNDLRHWLTMNGHLDDDAAKPGRPKEAMEAVLRVSGRPRSSARYLQLAQSVSLEKCADPSFQKLADTLRMWFPPTEA